MDRSGLAVEAAEMMTDKSGVRMVRREIGGVRITDVRVTPQAEQRLGKAAGRYITLEGDPCGDGMAAILRRALEQVIPARGRLFAAGLGNPDITSDSLGAFTVRGLAPRRGRKYSLAAIETDIAGRTGLDTAQLVRAAAREIHADCVIAVDALSCSAPKYIGRTVQISDRGIVPGSALSPKREGGLRQSELGRAAVSVGVPTVTLLSEITGQSGDSGFLVTTADIDVTVKIWADTIAAAINSIVR